MKVAVFLCVLGVAVVASSQPLTMSHTDSFAEVIRKFLPSILKKTLAEGGTEFEMVEKIDNAFYDLARTKINLQLSIGDIDSTDAARRLQSVDEAQSTGAKLYDNPVY
ncbi:hypothetical protein Pmani_021116 [Petrolisthes manimaculis]|uniref:Uncharacterized protein n=1 Tax=Petrolisthes manimaculis TaxID=1843537 RepID=A0AAE1U5S9_9EUCA|nr:hypothetical protein Pmani_021116 [Petrolisthes manimaculis]